MDPVTRLMWRFNRSFGAVCALVMFDLAFTLAQRGDVPGTVMTCAFGLFDVYAALYAHGKLRETVSR